MEQRTTEILKRTFRYGELGYTLVKTLLFIYVLRESNIEVPMPSSNIKPSRYLKEIHGLVRQNLNALLENNDPFMNDLIRDCIVSFNEHVDSYLDIEMMVRILFTMTNDDIKEFIINDANSVGERMDYSSPKELIYLAIGLLKGEQVESWFDLGCGNGDFLVRVAKENKKYKCYGEDINYNNHLLTRIRLYFTGCYSRISENNILNSEYSEEVDVAFAHTPFVMRIARDVDWYNRLNKYVGNLKPSQNADWIFADRLLQITKNKGVMLMSEGSLFNLIDTEQRKQLIDQNLIEGVIKMPANFLPYSGVLTSLVIFNKKKKDNTVKFLDATNMCVKGRRLAELNCEEILNSYNSDESVTKVDIEQIKHDNYQLNVTKYLDVNDIQLENETLLENVVEDIFRGVQIPANKIDEYSKVAEDEKVYKLISVGDIQNGSFDIDSLQVIKNDGKLERYLVKNGDVLISSKSTKVKTSIVENIGDTKLVATGSILVIRCDQEKINPVYLKVFFDSNKGKKILESIQTGTVIISINVSALLKMRISCVDRKLQDEVAEKFLMKLDQFNLAKAKLEKLEKELLNVFDDVIGG